MRSNTFGLVAVRHIGREGDALAYLELGIDILAYLSFVVTNERVSGLHDGLCAAVVLLQLAQLCIGVILLEVQDIADVRSAEGVDGLCIVAHYADMLVCFCQALNDHILRTVGVLVLIHEDVLEAFLVFLRHFGELL